MKHIDDVGKAIDKILEFHQRDEIEWVAITAKLKENKDCIFSTGGQVPTLEIIAGLEVAKISIMLNQQIE